MRKWLLLVGGVAIVLAVLAMLLIPAVASAMPANKWGKKPLTGSKLAWLQNLADRTRPVFEAQGFPASVALAQSAVETGYGHDKHGNPSQSGKSNPWGKRGSGDVGSDFITTTEFLHGEKVTLTNQQFARFSSLEAAARGYIAFVSGPSYKKFWALRSDPGYWLLAVWGMGYATGRTYGQSVVDASRKIAVSLDDASLAIPWDSVKANIAAQFTAEIDRKESNLTTRRQLTQKLLGTIAGLVA